MDRGVGMSRLYIAEKPEVARAIAAALGVGIERRNGYFRCSNGDNITWCYGHMLALCDPEDYDSKYGNWKFEDLPIAHIPWRKKPLSDKKEQIGVIRDLLAECTEIVHAGDPDDEGQLLVDELLEFLNCAKPVKRVLINDNNERSVKRALSAIEDNAKFRGLSQSAEARSVADQLYGYNMTRAYTLKAAEQGYQGVLSVGRVQTPILGLVVRRDRENQSHVKTHYYHVYADLDVDGVRFTARYVPNKDQDPIDDKGRLSDPLFARQIAEAASGQPVKILAAKTSAKRQSPPLPYNLLKLQADCSRKFGLKPDQVKDIGQSLKDKHRLITYHRSDCQYLNDEHFDDAADVLDAVGKTASVFKNAIASADTKIKSRAFNPDKVSAHHAIIPTVKTANMDDLTEDEKRVYLLIARAYIAQFWPDHEYNQTDIEAEIAGKKFVCRSNVTVKPGWMALYKNDQGNAETATDPEDLSVDLQMLKPGNSGRCLTAAETQFETKPRPLYTMDTLLNDLTRVAKYVQNPKLRELLIEKDKGKEGEHGGIGTPATRDEILRNLLDKGFLLEKGKNIVSSEIGQQLYDALPDQAKFPDMTALWHEQQQHIVQGGLDAQRFVNSLMEYISGEVERVGREGISLNVKKYPCPECGKPLRRMRGSKGFFWGCTGYKDGCKVSFSDKAGRPVLAPKKAEPSSKFKCMACTHPLVRRPGKQKGTHFWGCSNYPECKQYYPDAGGKPDYSKHTKG